MRDLTFQRVPGTENGRKDSRDSGEAVERPHSRRPVAREKRDASQTTRELFFREITGKPSSQST